MVINKGADRSWSVNGQTADAKQRPNQKRISLAFLKRSYDPAVNDVVVPNVARSILVNKFKHHLATDEFNEIGDELEKDGNLKWNNDGHLALTGKRLEYLHKLYKS